MRGKEQYMRRVGIIGTAIVSMLVFGLLLVPIVGASTQAAPALQTTAVATTAAATTAPVATAAAAATTAPVATTDPGAAATTPVTAPGNLPRTGGDSGISTLLLAAAALLILGVAAVTLMAS